MFVFDYIEKIKCFGLMSILYLVKDWICSFTCTEILYVRIIGAAISYEKI